MRILTQHAVDPELVKQIFRQLYYFMCAGALNNLLLRKDMCNWSKGMQIRWVTGGAREGRGHADQGGQERAEGTQIRGGKIGQRACRSGGSRGVQEGKGHASGCPQGVGIGKVKEKSAMKLFRQ